MSKKKKDSTNEPPSLFDNLDLFASAEEASRGKVDMKDDDGLGVACLDDNGILNVLSSETVDEGAGKNIRFVAGHCSSYVIYSRSHGSGSEIESHEEADAASLFSMSGTWQSLNKKVYGPVSTKWFVIIIMLALAGILFLYRPSKKKG